MALSKGSASGEGSHLPEQMRLESKRAAADTVNVRHAAALAKYRGPELISESGQLRAESFL